MLATALLRWAAPESCREFVGLDLEEEFYTYQVDDRGYAAARAWYWRQVLRSMWPMLARSVAGGNWEPWSIAIFLATAGQIAALDFVWSFILSQVPLKMDITRGTGYLIASLVLTTIAVPPLTATFPMLPAPQSMVIEAVMVNGL